MDANHRRTLMKRGRKICKIVGGVAMLCVLGGGSLMNPNFWSSPDERGDHLMTQHRYAQAARTYADPLRIGIAQYRDGEFEAAAKTFARVPGATGAYNAGNAWLMHGQYDTAIASYDKALGFKPGWQQALDNKQLAIARRDSMTISDKEREQESTEAYDPDKIVTDEKGGQTQDPDQRPMEGQKDASLQETWLRRVKTTPGQFLRAKFAWQEAQSATSPPP
jgi:Ca-activated chloride channel family protein